MGFIWGYPERQGRYIERKTNLDGSQINNTNRVKHGRLLNKLYSITGEKTIKASFNSIFTDSKEISKVALNIKEDIRKLILKNEINTEKELENTINEYIISAVSKKNDKFNSLSKTDQERISSKLKENYKESYIVNSSQIITELNSLIKEIKKEKEDLINKLHNLTGDKKINPEFNKFFTNSEKTSKRARKVKEMLEKEIYEGTLTTENFKEMCIELINDENKEELYKKFNNFFNADYHKKIIKRNLKRTHAYKLKNEMKKIIENDEIRAHEFNKRLNEEFRKIKREYRDEVKNKLMSLNERQLNKLLLLFGLKPFFSDKKDKKERKEEQINKLLNNRRWESVEKELKFAKRPLSKDEIKKIEDKLFRRDKQKLYSEFDEDKSFISHRQFIKQLVSNNIDKYIKEPEDTK